MAARQVERGKDAAGKRAENENGETDASISPGH
jgi:hypothetical protein